MEAKTPPASVSLNSELVTERSLPAGLLAATLHPGTQALYTAGMDGQVLEIDWENDRKEVIGQHESYASGVVLSADPNIVISSGYDGLLIWHDRTTKRPIHVVKAHDFWSWRLALAPNRQWVASVTGQYQSGGYKYEPATEKEPSIKVFRAQDGELVQALSHLPPVTSVCFSPDSAYLAAGNLMGEIRIYEVATGRLQTQIETPDFTSWGIIKSHHYIGGIFDLAFSPTGDQLFACGMGPMRDPMAGNGKQTWQRFAWQREGDHKTAEIEDGERGRGLMESLAIDAPNQRFAMAGRLAQGQWNAAVFDLESGALLHGLDSKMRITKALFSADGKQLILTGAGSQKGPKDGKWPDFGKLKVYGLKKA